MKNLYGHVIEVNTDRERSIAIEFYRRASKKPAYTRLDRNGKYVSLYREGGLVCCGDYKYPEEVVVKFKNIGLLADTQSRLTALKSVFKKFTAPKTVVVKDEVKKTPSKMLPIVSFWYPSSQEPHNSVFRNIRVVKCDDTDIYGYDINHNERFKKFKRAKVSGHVSLMAFNS